MDFEMLFVCWKVRPLAGNSSRKNMIVGTLIGPYASDQVRVDPVSARIPPAARGAPVWGAPLAVFVLAYRITRREFRPRRVIQCCPRRCLLQMWEGTIQLHPQVIQIARKLTGQLVRKRGSQIAANADENQ